MIWWDNWILSAIHASKDDFMVDMIAGIFILVSGGTAPLFVLTGSWNVREVCIWQSIASSSRLLSEATAALSLAGVVVFGASDLRLE